MPVPFRGIVHVTGEHDTGKTTFALECGALPPGIGFFDHDVKAGKDNDELGFKYYHDLVALRKGKKLVEFHLAVLELIDAIPDGSLDAIIWDNWAGFEKTFHPYVSANPGKFRKNYSPMGQIKGAEYWIEAGEYEGAILNQLLQKATMVICTSHLKAHNVNGVRTGKMIPACRPPLVEKSLMRLWLRHNPASPKPTGLVLKRINKRVVVEGEGITTVNVLPRRLPICTWKVIKEYLEAPFGDQVPTEEFLPNQFELDLLSAELTDDQMLVFQVGVEAKKREENEMASIESALANEAKELIPQYYDEGTTGYAEMKKKLTAAGHDASLADIVTWIKEHEENK